MDKINPSGYITDTDPVDEAVMNVSSWYESQSTSIADSQQIPWLLAQGWVVAVEYSTLTIRYVDTEDPETGIVTSTPITDTVAYRWDLVRRVLKPERALSDLIESFTNAYNTGRTLNDQRYDEILAIFQVILDKAEDAAIALESEDDAFDDLIEVIIAGISTDYTAYETATDGLFDTYGADERQRVDDKFDAEKSRIQDDLAERGLSNTTVLATINAGVERERSNADNVIEDSITRLKRDHEKDLYDRKTANVRSGLIAARSRLRAQLQSQELDRYTMRNRIAEMHNNFMERREDGYPDLGSIGALAANLGASAPTYAAP